ncbi:MAG: hypothetical protein ACRCX2_04870 [Paraclostridium sp.]
MIVSDFLKTAQSISGDYKLSKGTNQYLSFFDAINKAMEYIVYQAQPASFLRNISYHIPSDAICDFLKWRAPVSEDEYNLKNVLKNEIAKNLPEHSSKNLSPYIYFFHSNSSARNVVEYGVGYGAYDIGRFGIYSIINGTSCYVTYNEDIFSRNLSNRIDLLTTATYTLSTSIILPSQACSLYLKANVYDKGNGKNSLLAEIVFESYRELQTVNVNGITATLNLSTRRITVGSTKGSISYYYCEIWGRTMPITTPTVFLIKDNNVYANGNIQMMSYGVPSASVFFRAFILPPYLLSENQKIPSVIIEKKSLLECLLYKCASLYRRALGHYDSYVSLNKIADDVLAQYRNETAFSRVGDLHYNVINL